MTTYTSGVTSNSGVRQAGYTTTTQEYTTTSGVPATYLSGSNYGTTSYTTGTLGQPVTYGSGVHNVGYQSSYVTPGTTTTYTSVPATTTYVSGPTTTYNEVHHTSVPQTTYTNVINNGYTTTGGYTTTSTTGGAVYNTGAHLTGQRVVAEEIPVESRIEYIPFEKKYIEYDRVERIERVPYEQEIVEYEEIVHTERVPVERTITDYYAVETQIEYIPKEIEETIIEYEPVERQWERVQYLPVETQIIHYPETEKYVRGQTRTVQAGYTTTNTGYTTGGYTTGGYTTGSQVYQTTVPQTVTYQTSVPQTQTVTYQTTTPATTTSNYVYGAALPAAAYQAYQSSVPSSTTYHQVSSSQYGAQSGVVGGQSFSSGANGTGSNYILTSGGPAETSTYTSGGYAQPLGIGNFVTSDGTVISNSGNVVGGSQVKNNASYATNY